MPLMGAAAQGPARAAAGTRRRRSGRDGMRLPVKGLDGPTPLVRCLAEGPPIVWTGWNLDGRARPRPPPLARPPRSGPALPRGDSTRFGGRSLSRADSGRKDADATHRSALQLAAAIRRLGETCQYDAAAYADVRTRLDQVDGYLTGAGIAVLTCGRRAGDSDADSPMHGRPWVR